MLYYLDTVRAPPIYYQYAILRVHQNLHNVKLIDIGMSVENVQMLGDDDKMMKLLNRVQNYIEVTNEKILTGGEGRSNLKGLISLYSAYTYF